jgi:hypothetical protein
MKLHAALCFLLFAGCATVPASRAPDAAEASVEGGGGGPGGSPQQSTYPVRMETPAGTFLVSPPHAEDFKKILAGEPASQPFLAGGADF